MQQQLRLDIARNGGNRLGRASTSSSTVSATDGRAGEAVLALETYNARLIAGRARRGRMTPDQLPMPGAPNVQLARTCRTRGRGSWPTSRNRGMERSYESGSARGGSGFDQYARASQSRSPAAATCPSCSLALRDRTLQGPALSHGPDELPFAGELLQVRADAANMGRCGRARPEVLRTVVARSQRPLRRGGEWINERHLGTRLVYFRVPAAHQPAAAPQTARRRFPLL